MTGCTPTTPNAWPFEHDDLLDPNELTEHYSDQAAQGAQDVNLTSGIRRAALVRPRGLAIVQGMQRISWREVSERVARIAGGLQELGVEPGDRVATLAVNAPGYYELLMAIWWVGRPSPGADEGGAQALREWGIAP